MKQDLFDWLNSTHTSNTHDEGTAGNVIPPLLLAPVLSEQNHDEPPEPESTEPEMPYSEESAYSEPEMPHSEESAYSEPETLRITPSAQEQITAFNEAWQGTFTEESQDSLLEDMNTESEIPIPESENPITESDSTDSDSEALIAESDAESESPITESEYPSLPEEQHASILNQAWHEAAGFTINFNEPPQEMWTDIDSDSDDEPKDYEENMSLQGDAYIPVAKHGANFTQRLQATLQGRKAKAAKRRELDAENANRHPYLQKAVIFCGVLLMALGFGYFGLWFIQRETPDGINDRAVKLYEQGKFDEAENLYHRAYNRYPHVLGFLSGMARSAEKAGRTQTAIAAWNEYVSSLPKDDTEHRRAAQDELDRLIPGGHHTQTGQTRTQTIALPQQNTRRSQQTIPVTPTPSQTSRPQLPNVRALTFEEALTEANNAYNIGMFSRAIANFHKAHAIRENDIRPYIGLAASYRAKGLYFDAKRMLDEARRKFGINPAIEVERYYLRRE